MPEAIIVETLPQHTAVGQQPVVVVAGTGTGAAAAASCSGFWKVLLFLFILFLIIILIIGAFQFCRRRGRCHNDTVCELGDGDFW